MGLNPGGGVWLVGWRGRLWLRRIGFSEAGCFLELLAKSIRELLVRADALGNQPRIPERAKSNTTP